MPIVHRKHQREQGGSIDPEVLPGLPERTILGGRRADLWHRTDNDLQECIDIQLPLHCPVGGCSPDMQPGSPFPSRQHRRGLILGFL
jgi:hypothetical protein